MQNNNVHIRYLGEKAIEVSWPQKIDLKTLEAIKITSERLLKHYKDAVEDIIPAYASLLLVFSKPIDITEEIDKISSLLLNSNTPNQKNNFRWFVPVCYHPSFGWDIEDVCQAKKIEPSTLI